MLYIMIAFAIIGGMDKLIGDKYGLGSKFEEGFKAIGGLALTVIGMYCLSPVIGRILIPILNPVADILKTDPSVFISSLIAVDMGGHTTSMIIGRSELIGNYNGLILASMLGTVVSFTLPIAVNLIKKEDFPYFAKGILCGIITVPIGMIVSGLMMKIPYKDIILNAIPVLIFAGIITWGIIRAQEKTIEVFNIMGKIILFISTLGLLLVIIEYFFNITIIQGILSFEEGAILVVKIGIILSGAYPLLFFISRKLHKYLKRISEYTGLDEYSILGLISSLANCIPMMGVYENMNKKGKVLNAAFAASGAFTFGGQLGYISAVSPETVNPYILGKLIAGISAVILASVLISGEEKYNSEEEGIV